MKFQDMLRKSSRQDLWQIYCGFFDMSLENYMYTQRRLMEEQIARWCASGLGKKFIADGTPGSIEDFLQAMPLTDYADYAEVLLNRRADLLPAQPVVWIQTTWEGGLHPIKLAPYSRDMLDTYCHNLLAVTMLASSRSRADITVQKGDRVLYGGAPLPYITGLLPSILDEELQLTWLPDTNEHSDLSFSQRIKKGFEMAVGGGLDFFFATGSVANYITEHFSMSGSGGGHKSKLQVSPVIAFRYLRAKYLCRRDGRAMTPGDVFQLKGMVCTGTDSSCYHEALKQAWGVDPIELAAGTESTCVAVENYEHRGMVFFPDACFYEFIPKSEMLLGLSDPDYRPRTCLMDQVEAGSDYELVISVLHGGAFMRYRIGDVYRCVSADLGELPRFTFQDRVPTVIDIAGFTRITRKTVEEVLRLSKLDIDGWIARKEFDQRGFPYLHMYLELDPAAQGSAVTKIDVLRAHMAVYFQSFDSDYGDLKKLLGMEPLQLTVLRHGALEAFAAQRGREIEKINCSAIDLADLLNAAKTGGSGEEAMVG